MWDLQVDGAGGVGGTVEVGDQQPWTVTGVMEAEAFRWRAANPRADPGERWSSGFVVTGRHGGRASAPASRWSSDTGRADDWIGTVLEGRVPPDVLTNRRGPALR